MPVFKLIGNSLSEVTIPPTRSVMENRAPDIISDRSSITRDAGHLYGFMILRSTAYGFSDGLYLNDHSPVGTVFEDAVQLSSVPSEYFFTVSPKTIHVSEPSTVSIQPTMGRNYHIEHQGSLLKQLSVTGTTGFRPMAASAKAPPSVGGRIIANVLARTTAAALDIVDAVRDFSSLIDARMIPVDEVTGYFNFVQLRNLFRKYNHERANPSSNGSVPYMVWVNFHEYEYWICEPQTFQVTRDAANPLTFGYDINATLLRKLDNLGLDDDWLRKMISFWDVTGTINSLISKFTNLALAVSRFPDAVVGDITGTTRRFFRSLTGLVNSLSIVENEWDLISIRDRLLADIGEQAQSLKNAWDLYTASSDSPAIKYEDTERSNVFSETVRLINRFRAQRRDIISAIVQKGANGTLRDEQAAYQRTSDKRERDTNFPKGTSSNFGELSDIRNDRGFGGNTQRTIVGVGEDIRMISKRMYGNEAPWKRLVLFNNLRAPYIASTGANGILQPGDTILVPGVGSSNNSKIDGNLVLHTDAADFSQNINNLDPEVVLYGRDIKANFQAHQSTSGLLLEFALTPSGDIATIEGRDNLVQALTVLSNTATGELQLHPTYGFPKLVGRRSTSASAAMWVLQARQALSKEPRIATLSDISVAILGDALVARLDLVAERSLSRIPITTLQRA